MTSIRRVALAAAVAAGLAVLSATPASAAPSHPDQHRAPVHPVFVQNDAVTGNTVVAYQRTPSGGLVRVGSYPTGGNGGVLAGSVVDHLASEGSLAYDAPAHLLYAVNAGSDTVTVFSVDGARLTRRQVLGSGGDFPVSVAVHGTQVFVLNARGGGSVAGFRRAGGRLVPVPGWHRGLGLDPAQTPEFTSTPGQIGFTPDGAHLVVTTKNGGNTIDVFPVGRTGPAAHPVVTATPGAVPFGFAFDAQGHLVVTEAGPSAVATFRVGRDGRLTALDSVVTGQAATCWAVLAGGVAYVSNAGSGTLSAYRVDSHGRLTGLGTTATDAGTVDAAVSGDGRYLYVQAGAAGNVDAYRIGRDGSLTPTGSVTVPDAAGAEGIVAP